ncbi:hypothetical protein JTB14_020569 [Gonioctena quinquepunctata]|nr:hypothetical protein JTB14_020569 [Gonioctena quinquepunctata]
MEGRDGQKVKEEPTEIISFNDQSNENCLEQREDEKFNESDSNKFEVTLRESVEEPREIKLSPTHVCEYTNFNVDGSECGLIEGRLQHPTNRNHAVEPLLQL